MIQSIDREWEGRQPQDQTSRFCRQSGMTAFAGKVCADEPARHNGELSAGSIMMAMLLYLPGRDSMAEQHNG